MAANRKKTRATMEISRRRPLRLALLASVSLLPMAGDLILATRAEASACVGNTIVSACSNLTISSPTGLATISSTVTGDSAVFVNNASVGTLANSGLISGASTGIHNYENTINTLINNGSIHAGAGDTSYGIYNDTGYINNLTNGSLGSISATTTAIYNTGTIGTLTNNGHITAANSYGLYNDNSITSLDNGTNAVISSYGTGLYNDGTVGTLTNEGTITVSNDAGIENDGGMFTSIDNGSLATIISSNQGIYNTDEGTIGTITNEGLITVSGNEYGIENNDYSSITSIYNGTSGTIAGGAGDSGIYNYDNSNIGTLTNYGLITGDYGIDNYATITSVDNGNTGSTLGTIQGSDTAFYNDGSVGTLTNSGLIQSTSADGIYNDGTITSIGNSVGGTISGSHTGIVNENSIATLTNSGTITSTSKDGIYNDHNITSIDNTVSGMNIGLISGYTTGIQNTDGGSIGALSNEGSIHGSTYGIANITSSSIAPLITSLSNTGNISGATAVYNNGTIQTMNNGGTITGTTYGVANVNNGTISALINALDNTGTITGSTAGVWNSSDATIYQVYNHDEGATINSFLNDGSIGSGAIDTAFANENSAVIGTLTNNGEIKAINRALYNYDEASIGTLINDQYATIDGYTTGVENAYFATIGTLINNGNIDGGFAAISNYTSSTIDVLTIGAQGDVYGGYNGIFNDSISTIEQLNNSGYIGGYTYNGIYNGDSSIGTLKNVGEIYGGEVGVNNDLGSISLLKNYGTITGGNTGILNIDAGTIYTLSDLGVIEGTNTGIANVWYDSYPTYIDQLTIYGSVIGGVNGIFNSGFIDTIYNTHEIAATDSVPVDYEGPPIAGIWNEYGSIGLLNNYTNGLITGAMYGVLNDSYIEEVSNVFTITGTAGTGMANYGFIGLLSNTGTLGDTGVIQGYDVGVRNSGANVSIDTIVNAGTIFGDSTGLVNEDDALIETLTNTGTIGGYSAGVENVSGAFIGTVINSGLIYGTNDTGVYSDGAGIGVLSNSGTIIGGKFGVDNYEDTTIGTLTNSGLITGANDGVLNDYYATIGDLINSGTISSTDYAVDNYDEVSIFTLDNSGLITSGDSGVLNEDYATIGTLNNSGTIIGGGDGAVFNYDVAVIDALDNSGTISSPSGLAIDNYDGGTIGTLINSGLVSGGEDGIYSDSSSTIGPVTNSGSITGATDGIYNGGLITGITNSGLIAATGTVGSGRYGAAVVGLQNDVGGSIGVVANLTGGTISGGSSGVYNLGVIDTLTNAGVITGASSGVDNEGTVGALTNSGTISGGSSGVDNEGGTISTLVNTGTIIGTTGAGVYNSYSRNNNTILGTIGLLGNSGVISGGATGIYNTDLISAITNSGTISGGTGDGILNDTGGTINIIQNFAGGQILGGADGINAGAGSVSISNAGVIKGVAGYGVVFNSGTLTNLAGGTISGTTGVDVTGNNAVVFDAGTIISTNGGNAILVAPLADPAQIVLTTGSAITGTINGGGTDGSITLEGTGSLPNTIADFTTGSTLTVVPGAKWTGSGNWTVATVTNNGTFEGGTLGTPLTLTGNYVQTAGGTLLVVVTPKLTSQFIINGTASLEGTLDYAFAPGTYTQKTYSFITATGGISGAFSAANYMGSVPPVLLHATKGVTDAANLILSGTIVSNPKPIVIVTPEDDSIYADAGQAAAQAAQEANAGVLDYVTDEALTTDPGAGYGFADESASPMGNHYEAALLGTPASTYGATSNSGGACAAGGSVPPHSGVNTTGSQMANAFADGFCGAGGWLEGSVGASNVNGSGDASNYSTNSGGFLAGVDKVVNPSGTRLGVAVGYDETWLHDNASGKDSIDTTRVGLYGAQPLGQFVLAGDFMLGFANNTATRPTGVGPAHATYSGTDYGGGVQLATQMDYNGVTVRPAAGIRFAAADSNGFSESGVHYVPAFAITGATSTDTSVQPYVKVGVSRSFLTQSDVAVTPSASIGYTVEAGDTGKSVTVTSVDGTQFASAHTSLNSSAAELTLGLAAGKDNWSLYAHYSAYLAGNWTAQVGEAGLQVRF